MSVDVDGSKGWRESRDGVDISGEKFSLMDPQVE
jgi:hypothetical protein